MARPSAPDVQRAKQIYGDLFRAVLDLNDEFPESRHIVALATVLDAFHDDILRPLEGGAASRPLPPVGRNRVGGDLKLH
jgi:hypothetical protein